MSAQKPQRLRRRPPNKMPVLPVPEDRPTDINFFGWRRFLLRIEQRALWHARGVHLWLVRRPHLRKLPAPWPGTQSAKQYLEQPGGKIITPKVFEELCALRSKIGLRRSFVQSTTVLMALRIGFRHREPTLQPGLAPGGPDGEEKGVSNGKGSTYRPPAYSRLRLTDARNRLRLYGLDPTGRKLGELQILIRDCRESHGWGLEEQFDAQVASAVSFEHRRSDGTIYAPGKAPPIYHLNGMYQHFKNGKNLNAEPPDATSGAPASRQAPVPCPEYDQAYLAPLVGRLEQALHDLQSERSSLRSGDRSTPSSRARGQRVETYSLLSEDDGMEDDEIEQDPVQQAAADFPVEEPEPGH